MCTSAPTVATLPISFSFLMFNSRPTLNNKKAIPISDKEVIIVLSVIILRTGPRMIPTTI